MKLPLLLLLVLSAVALAVQPGFKNEVLIKLADGVRKITGNGIPDHEVGEFPNRHCPNTISAQNYAFGIPANPKIADKPTPSGMSAFGVAVNGVVFDPAAAEWWQGDRNSGWQYEPLGGGINLGTDQNNAHVQPNGAYHYHGMPNELVKQLTGDKPAMVLLGWASDGFPIYGPWGYADPKDVKSELRKVKSSYRIKNTPRNGGPGGTADGTFVADYEYQVGLGDLDECNGRVGVTPEFPGGIYHYHITDAFPFIPRLSRGTPDPSFAKHGPPGGGGPRRGGPGAGRGGPQGQRGGQGPRGDGNEALERLILGPFPF